MRIDPVERQHTFVHCRATWKKQDAFFYTSRAEIVFLPVSFDSCTEMIARNHALAALLQSMANLLAGRRENPYRVRAYRKAAQSILELPEDIGDIAQRGELQTIPGIGKDLSRKIEEFLARGTFAAYEELKTPLPPEIRSWSTLPGFSEPFVHDLYFRWSITTLDDLERLVRSHLLRTIPGMTASTPELLAAITQLRIDRSSEL